MKTAEFARMANDLLHGRAAFSPKLGLVATPTGQVFYSTDWVAKSTLSHAGPAEEELRKDAKELAAGLRQATGEGWLVGPKMPGAPSPIDILRAAA